ncbi:MAG: DUF3500 domain-containing protein [Planctomycetaceae bacterium]
MSHQQSDVCTDCQTEFDFSRRDFVRTATSAAVGASVLPLVGGTSAQAAPSANSAAEKSVKKLYDSLSDKQRETICFAYGHKLQYRLSANWAITKPKIGDDFYTDAQRDLIDQIVKGVTSEDGYDRLKLQMKDDRPGGMNAYSIAIFGKPGTGKFQWELTGRHLTLRADGDSDKGMAFGGPLAYGHGVGNPKKNLFFYQTQKTNEVFKALDPKQRKVALLPKSPRENQVPLQGKTGMFPGLAVGEMSADQQELVESAIKVILAPYRKEDVDDAIALLKKGGGLKKLHMAFYQNGDLNNDKVWDIWRVEGPTFVWHFRGAPHVHAYINIGIKKA